MSNTQYEAHKSSHDSFDEKKHRNWLSNSAGLGVYAHGRIHQEVGLMIFVGDIVHKRGLLVSDDVLKMEEQSLDSYSDALTVPSTLGPLKAIAVMPNMNSATGEGDVIAYYEGGVVSFDTFKAPRETRLDGEGKIVQAGWSQQRMVTHLLNTVSAVGRYAVAVLPRDHFFRSVYGLHFLKTVVGDSTFNPENIDLISSDVQPLLNADSVHNLDGAAVGNWVRGHRLFASVGLTSSPENTATAMGRGFLSINQATSFSEDRTPRTVAEGLWVPDHGIVGIHQFLQLGIRPEKGCYGFLSSGQDDTIYFANIDEDAEEDHRDGEDLPIEWSCETGYFFGEKDGQRKKLTQGLLEGTFSQCSGRVRILVRTDEQNEWALWHEFRPCDTGKNVAEKFLRSESLGLPPQSHREATWFQFRLEGIGYAEIRDLKYDVSDAGSKAGKSRCVAVGSNEIDLFITNDQPPETRWTA